MELKNFIFRIDDRLIHGQVNVGWIQPLELKRVYVVDDLAANDFLTCNLWKYALDDNMELEVMTFQMFKKKFNQLDFNDSILLVRSVKSGYEIFDHIGKFTNVLYIGGLHFQEDKKEIFSWLYLSQTDGVYMRKLMDKNIEILLKPVYNSKEIHVTEEFLKDKGL